MDTTDTSSRAASGPGLANEIRAASAHHTTGDRLGPLKDLPGFWEGSGFSLTARPNFGGGNPNGLFLQLNMIRETIEFTAIGSPVTNRGSVQDDITVYGVTYLQRVTDAISGGALHVEPGMMLNIPATESPAADAAIARLCTVPHGNSVCASGFSVEEILSGAPTIPPINTVPFEIGAEAPAPGTPNPFPEYQLDRPSAYRTDPLPPGVTQALIDDPNVLLRSTLQAQVDQGYRFNKVVLLITQTGNQQGISNIGYIQKNADTTFMHSVFGIQSVTSPAGEDFLQLQYGQTVLLNFRGMSFPHITCATLVKAF
jgi:hypothetical protein